MPITAINIQFEKRARLQRCDKGEQPTTKSRIHKRHMMTKIIMLGKCVIEKGAIENTL